MKKVLVASLIFACLMICGCSGKAENGLRTENGATYYYSDGVAVTDEWHFVDGNYYYFGSDGAALKGFQKIGDSFCDFDENAVRVKKYASEFVTYNGEIYYAKPSGTVAKNEWVTVDGVSYRASETGALLRGWQTVDDERYYFKPDGALARSETFEIDGESITFDGNGRPFSGESVTGQDDAFTKLY